MLILKLPWVGGGNCSSQSKSIQGPNGLQCYGGREVFPMELIFFPLKLDVSKIVG